MNRLNISRDRILKKVKDSSPSQARTALAEISDQRIYERAIKRGGGRSPKPQDAECDRHQIDTCVLGSIATTIEDGKGRVRGTSLARFPNAASERDASGSLPRLTLEL